MEEEECEGINQVVARMEDAYVLLADIQHRILDLARATKKSVPNVVVYSLGNNIWLKN